MVPCAPLTIQGTSLPKTQIRPITDFSMGHRLSKIYTRTGDDGTTGLGDGSRVPKDSLRVETFMQR